MNYHGAGGGDMDGSEYEASSDEDTTDEEGDGEELEPVCAVSCLLRSFQLISLCTLQHSP